MTAEEKCDLWFKYSLYIYLYINKIVGVLVFICVLVMEKLPVLVNCLHSKGKEQPQKSQCDRKEISFGAGAST